MTSEEMNLCVEIGKTMEQLQFHEHSVVQVKSHPMYLQAFGQQPTVQRTFLTMMLHGILLKPQEITPSQIRLALNIATDVRAWLDDIRLVVLPFLKENEEKFFGVQQYAV